MDEFEQRLQRLALRKPPGEWRDDILAAAVPQRAASPRPAWTTVLRMKLREWLWPCPEAWAGLAATWVVILTLNSIGSRDGTATSKPVPQPSPEVLMALREQRRLLAELMEPPAGPERPALFVPRRRSEKPSEQAAV